MKLLTDHEDHWKLLSKKNKALKMAPRFKQNIWENDNATDSNRLHLYSGEIGLYHSMAK